MNSGYDINQLVQAAQRRWLKPAEVLFILQNHDNGQITQKAPQKPTSGSLFLFNKRVLRFFRKDGHNWRKKRDGRNVGEAHERLKVGNAEALNCYYAHGEDNPNFQRRSYWMLDPVYEHIVLVHYRDITEQGKPNSGSILEFSPGSSYSFSNFAIQNQGTTSLSDQHASYQSLSSPVSVEVCSEIVAESHKIDHINNLDGGGKGIPSPEIEVGQALRRLEEQLSLDDDRFKECLPFGNQSCSNFGSENQGTVSLSDIHGSYQSLSSTGTVEVSSEVFVEGQGMNRAPNDSTSPQLEVSQALRKLEEQLSLDDKFKEYFPDGNQNQDKDGCALPGCDIGLRKLDQGNQHNLLGRSDEGQARESLSWNDVFELSTGQSLMLPHSNDIYSSYGRDKQLSSSKGADKELENYLHLHSDRKISIKSSSLIPQDFQSFNVPAYSFSQVTRGINTPGYYSILCESDQFQMPLGANSGLTIAQEQKFKITEISPEWGFANEVTKVIIIGSFLCNPSELKLTCMFGDVEVPVQIIQDGVLCCQAPPSHPGKVTLCITSGNREACSEVRGFEYINKHNACNNCINPQQENRKSLEELLLVVRLGQMLLSDSTMQKREGSDLLETDSWGHIMDDILTGSETSCGIMGKVLQEVMKDKLQQWLSSRSLEENDNSGCALSKKEQGILHVIAGLGYEWALNSILAHGVGVNFRDINGWTALHWAARFGREKMVAALIAYGASPGAVTDPTEQDPVGKTPASIASACGHKGLAGYLSELALTTHLSSLTLEETELSKCSAVVEAEATVGNISSEIVSGEEDQQSMKQTLAAVRNAAQAAARIQSAFRAHSFRKRQLCETATSGGGIDDEYVFTSDEIQGLSAASKLVFRHLHDHNIAALSIQKNYRSWKGRKDFLALRQKVVKIQAHIRGYQVRKKYKVICWAVGIYDKVVLRWRRKGAGLRVYKPEAKSIDGEEEEEEEDEDILKSFRKQKVDGALNEAVSRVLSMVDCPEARQQYNRMLERFQEAKAELDILADEAASTSQADVLAMDSDDMYLYP